MFGAQNSSWFGSDGDLEAKFFDGIDGKIVGGAIGVGENLERIQSMLGKLGGSSVNFFEDDIFFGGNIVMRPGVITDVDV